MDESEGDHADRQGDVDPAVRPQIMLAEYAALRAEIERRATAQWSVFALQLASAGAIASVAISAPSNLALLLLATSRPATSHSLHLGATATCSGPAFPVTVATARRRCLGSV
jgi:hypothetical protein